MTLDDRNVFSGKLTDFISTATTSHYSWQFIATLPSSESPGSEPCNFDFIFKAWQTNVTTFDDGGYSDSETVQNIISRRVVEPPPAPRHHENDEDKKDKEEDDNDKDKDEHEEHDEIIGESTTTTPIIEQVDDIKPEDTALEPTPTPSPAQE